MDAVGLPYDLMVKNIRTELKNYITTNGIKSLVLGVSGGIDSAICAALARPVCDELGIPLIGRSIPISTNTSEERDRAVMIGHAFCTDFDEDYQLEDIYSSYWNIIELAGWESEDPRESFRKGNLKARLRMILLYDLAQLHRGMVLSTDNYTEYLLGFWTLHGDVGDYGMIQKLWKTEVYSMAEYLVQNELPEDGKYAMTWGKKALQSCIDCQATDGLGITATDLDQILPGWEGTSRDGYTAVDMVLFSYLIGVKLFDGAPIEDHPVIKRHLSSAFKRSNPMDIKRSLIIPQPITAHEKKMVDVSVHTYIRNKPYTKEYLDALSLQPEDIVNISYEEEEFRSDGGDPAGWYINVIRTRLETDSEFSKRIEREELDKRRRKKMRYESYLKLKTEFED